jgi:DNA-binding SARP family transcriptional activator
VEFRILGELEVLDGARCITPTGTRARALLVLLLTSANEVVASDRLIGGLWGGEPPRESANALQYHVSRLRKLLAPDDMIVTREPGYLIRVAPEQLDLLRFEQLVGEAQSTIKACEIPREYRKVEPRLSVALAWVSRSWQSTSVGSLIAWALRRASMEG